MEAAVGFAAGAAQHIQSKPAPDLPGLDLPELERRRDQWRKVGARAQLCTVGTGNCSIGPQKTPGFARSAALPSRAGLRPHFGNLSWTNDRASFGTGPPSTLAKARERSP